MARVWVEYGYTMAIPWVELGKMGEAREER